MKTTKKRYKKKWVRHLVTKELHSQT